LQLSFDYNKGLFNASTINIMAKHFEALLQSIVANPGAQLSALKEQSNEIDKQQQIVTERQLEKASLQRLKQVRRRVVSASSSRGETSNGTHGGGFSVTAENRTVAEASRLDGNSESLR
jgi:non-ribosomal peptide synthetase component F